MRRLVKCPNCRTCLVISVFVPPPVVTFETAAESPVLAGESQVPLTVRIERLLEKAGRRGMTRREIQQRLKGVKVDSIVEAIWPLHEAGAVEEERRGQRTAKGLSGKLFYILKAAAWKEAVEADEASVKSDTDAS
jgi:hypothetical protein